MSAALKKLINVMGPERGQSYYREILDELGLDELGSPEDSARFGQRLIARGGVLASIGRSIKIQALLHGARVSD